MPPWEKYQKSEKAAFAEKDRKSGSPWEKYQGAELQETEEPKEGRTLFGLPQDIEKAVFPRAVETEKRALEDDKFSVGERLQHAASGAADLLSLPGRGLSALGALGKRNIQKFLGEEQTGETFKEALGRTKAKEDGLGGIGENIVRDPATIPMAAATGGIGSLAKMGLGKIGAGAVAGATEGVVGAGVHQLEKFGETGKIDPKEAALEVGISTATGAAIPAVGQVLKKSAGKLNKLIGEFAQWTSGVDEKALRMGGNKTEREVLKKSFDKQFEIGEELVTMIESANEAMPNYKEVVETLDKVPSVNVQPLMSKLQKVKGTPYTKEAKKIATKVSGKIDELRDVATTGEGGFIRPNELNKFRIEIDQIIDDSFGKESNKYITTLKELRHDIQSAIKKSAKGTEYETIINDYSNKLDKVSKMKKLVGWDAETRELRAENFIKNINNKGRKKAKEWLGDFEEVFGGDFVEKANLARLADMMGESGKGDVLPRWTTGRSLWATKAAGAMVGSPRAASQVTLPTLGKLAKETPKKAKGAFGRRAVIRKLTDEEE